MKLNYEHLLGGAIKLRKTCRSAKGEVAVRPEAKKWEVLIFTCALLTLNWHDVVTLQKLGDLVEIIYK